MTHLSPLFVGFEGLEPDWSMLEEIRPAGVIIFTRNIASAKQLADVCGRINQLKPRPIIAMDLEGGRVNRLDGVLGSFPQPSDFGTPDAAEEAGLALGAALNCFGIGLDFAPVVDLDFGNINNGLHSRTLGSDPKQVGDLARAFLLGLRQTGVEGCLKHFPGLGTTKGDSHLTLPRLRIKRSEWSENEAQVYRQLAGPDTLNVPLMLAHCRIPFWEDQVASASPHAVNWLRSHEFQGLMLTDDLEMKAIDQDRIDQYACTALAAGVDAVLVCHDAAKIHKVFRAFHDNGFLEKETCERLTQKIQMLTDGFASTRRWSMAEVKGLWSKINERFLV